MVLIRKVATEDGHTMVLVQDGATCFSVKEHKPDGRIWSFVNGISNLTAANTRFDNNMKSARHQNIFYVSD